jgi:hypothetical protein
VNAAIELAFEARRLLIAHLDVAHEGAFAAADADPPARLAAFLPDDGYDVVRVATLTVTESCGPAQAPEKTRQP